MSEQEPQSPEKSQNSFDKNLKAMHPHDLHNFAKELIAANDLEGMQKIYDFADKRRDKVYSESIDYWACIYIMDDVSKALSARDNKEQVK